jgi:low affinity Fe/Cu permease
MASAPRLPYCARGVNGRNGMVKRLNELGSRIAGRTADLAGAPLSILLVAMFCAGWFIRAGAAGENTLTLILSVASITLTQMVLNGQRRSEQALHLKMDELVYAMQGARNEVAGIESKSTEELEALRRTGDAAEEELQDRGAGG